MKDVLLVTPYYDPNIVGGAEISTQLIAEGLRGRCDVLTFGRTNGRRLVNGVDVYEVNLPKFESLWAATLDGTVLSVRNKLDGHLGTLFPTGVIVARYRDFIRVHGYRTVIMNANETVMDRASLWKGAHDSGARVVLTLRDASLLSKHMGWLDLSVTYRRIIRRQLEWVDALVAPSQYMIDLYADAGMAKADSRVIPNAVDEIDVPEVAFGDKEGVIYAGSVTEEKGIGTLLQAVPGLPEGTRVEVVGRGPLVEACRGSEGVEVHDWMPRQDLYREIAGKKVLVLPSVWPEAFGRVLVEAVMCGTLVVGSDAGAIPEVLDNDERYVFPKGSVSELESRINRILRLSKDEYAFDLRELQTNFERFSVCKYVNAWSNAVMTGSSY